MSRPPDITIADFWEIEKYAPEFAEKKSFSLVIVNTEKGKEVFKQIEYNKKKISYIIKKYGRCNIISKIKK